MREPCCSYQLSGAVPPIPRSEMYHTAKTVSRDFWESGENIFNALWERKLPATGFWPGEIGTGGASGAVGAEIIRGWPVGG